MRKYKKSFQLKREELKESLYRIEGAIKRYKEKGVVAELGTMAIELRGLLLGEALLISLAKENNFPLVLFSIPPADAVIKDGLTHHFIVDSVSLTKGKPYTLEITIQQWLEMPVAEINGTIFNPKRLITEIASTGGPAHYSDEISTALMEMKQFTLGGVPGHYRTLLNFSEALIVLGARFLRIY